MTRFGVILPQHEAGPAELLGAAKMTEEAGLHSVWVSDHLWGHPGGPARPMLEAWTSLAAVAASTSKVKVGTLVTRVSLRRPRVLAGMAETVERIAPGRLVVALGIGDATNRDEQIAYGISWPDKAGRLALMDETIVFLRELVPSVPVWVGGVSDDLLGRAARVEGWNFWGPAPEFAGHRARLEAAAGGKMPETSWAGSLPKREELKLLQSAGVDHILVAVGAKNFSERIPQVADLTG